ncbi:MAG: hypothetical protein ACI9K2_000182 [Myxococcota bacterium]|jgi:hypothetical protein
MRATLPTLFAGLLLASCAPDTGKRKVSQGVCGDLEPTRHLVARQLFFARAADGVAQGFDLDGAVTASGDATGCGKEDYTSPDGVSGVDNAIAGLLPFLDSTEAVGLEPLIQSAINGGEILVLLELTGLDDLRDDDCVGVRLLFGDGVPAVGSDGLLLVDQTFPVSDEIPMDEPVIGTLRDGVLEAEGLAFDLPVDIFDANLVFEISNAAVRLSMNDETGIGDGILGGSFPYSNVLDGLLDTNIDQGLKDALPALVSGLSDLEPAADGLCQNMSVTLELGLADAFVYSEQ